MNKIVSHLGEDCCIVKLDGEYKTVHPGKNNVLIKDSSEEFEFKGFDFGRDLFLVYSVINDRNLEVPAADIVSFTKKV